MNGVAIVPSSTRARGGRAELGMLRVTTSAPGAAPEDVVQLRDPFSFEDDDATGIAEMGFG
jgi:hypothetical protein